jgi:hypothetical protein
LSHIPHSREHIVTGHTQPRSPTSKAANFPSDTQLPLNPFEKMDKVRVTIPLALLTLRHRCAALLHPSRKRMHFLQWHTHLSGAVHVVQPCMGPPCSHPWQSGPRAPGPLIHHANQSSDQHIRRWLTLSLATLTPPAPSTPPPSLAPIARPCNQSPESIIGFQANVRQRRV